MSSIVARFLSLLFGRVGAFILGFLITPVLVRVLGSSQYGDYSFLISTMSILMVVINGGIIDAVRKFISESRSKEFWKEYVFLFYSTIGLSIALIFGGFVYVFLRNNTVAEVLGPEFKAYFTILAIILITRQIFSVFKSTIMGLSLEKLSEPIGVLRKFFYGVFGITLAYVGYDITGVLYGHIIAYALCSLVLAFIVYKELSLKDGCAYLTNNLKTYPKKPLLTFNALSVVFILLATSLYHVDIILIRIITGSQETGYYRAALVIAELLWFIPLSLQMLLLQESSKSWSEGDKDKINRLSSRVTKYNIVFSVLVVIGMAALATKLFPLYFGPEFEKSVIPFLIVLPGALGFAIARPIFSIGQGKGEMRILIIATGLAAVINLILNLLLIPQFGIYGAAFATSIGYGSMLLFHIFAARIIGHNPIEGLNIGRIMLAGVLFSVLFIPIPYLIPFDMLSLLVSPIIGLTIYCIIVIKLGVITNDELRQMSQYIPEWLINFKTS